MLNARSGKTGRMTTARARRTGWLLSTGLMAVPAVSVSAVSVSAVSAPAVSGSTSFHAVHVSHLRLVVEGATVAVQARLFHDDLQDAVRAHARQPALVLSSAAGDSAFARYFAASVGVTANGAGLVPRLLQARDERDGSGVPMRVYVVEYAAPSAVRSLALRDALLFERFRDQQNLAVVLRMPGERRTSLFFATGDTKAQAVPL